MAKVYDALKRLEQERSSRETQVPAMAIVAELQRSESARPASLWRRWSRRGAADPRAESRTVAAAADVAQVLSALDEIREQLPRLRQDLVRTVDARLADLAGREPDADPLLSEIEHNILHKLDARFTAFSAEHDRGAQAAVERLAARIERLQARQTLVLVVAAAVLLLTLLH